MPTQTIRAILTLDNTQFNANLTASQTALEGFVGSTSGLTATLDDLSGKFTTLGVGIAGVATAVGGYSVDQFSKLQQAMFQLKNFAGVPGDQIQTLQSQIEKLADSTGVSAEDIAQAGYHIYSSGITGKAGFEALQYASEGAAMGMGNAGDVANTITQLMVNFGVSAKDSFNAMIVATRDGNMSVSDFANNFANVATEASQLHIPLNTAIADFDAMTRANHNAAESQTELSGIINGFLKPSKTLNDQAQSLGYANATAMEQTLGLNGALKALQGTGAMTADNIGKLFANVRGLRGVMALMGSDTSVDSTLKDLNNDSKVGSKAWSDYTKTLQYQFSVLKTSVNTAAANIGEALGPALSPLLTQIKGVVDSLDKWVSKNSKTIASLIELALKVGGILLAIGGILKIAAFITALLDPLNLVILAIAILATMWIQNVGGIQQKSKPVFDYLQKVWKDVQSAISIAWSIIKPALEALWKVIQDQLGPTFRTLQAVFQNIQGPLKMIGELFAIVIVAAILLVIGILSGLAGALGNIVSNVAIVFQGVLKVVGGFFGFFIDLFTGHFDKLGTDLGNFLGGFYDIWSGTLGLVVGTIWHFITGIIDFFHHLYDVLVGHSIIPDLVNEIFGWFSKLVNQGLTWGKDLIDNIVNGIENGVSKVSNAAQKIGNTIKSFLHFSKPDTGPLADADKWMPDMVDLMSRGLRMNLPKLQMAINGALAGTGANSTAYSYNQVNNVNINGGSNSWQQRQDMSRTLQSLSYQSQFM